MDNLRLRRRLGQCCIELHYGTTLIVSFAAARAGVTQCSRGGKEHCVTPARAAAKETTPMRDQF